MEKSIEEIIFDESYEVTMKRLDFVSAQEGFEISQLEGELVHLARYEGQDWVGRGELKNSEISAQVLAYQVFIKRWKDRQSSEQLDD